MVLTNWGGVNLSPTALNNQFRECLTVIGQNHIRSLLDRAGIYSKGEIDGWGEAYTSITGRNGSVNTDTGNTNSAFITPGDTVTDSETSTYAPGFTSAQGTGSITSADVANAANAFDGDVATYASCTTERSHNSFASFIGKTFSASTISYVRVHLKMQAYYNSGSSHYVDAKLQTYNGSTWSDVYTFPTYEAFADSPGITSYDAESVVFNGVILLNASVQGIRIAFNVETGDVVGDENNYAHFYELDWGVATTAGSLIEHAIPSGTFASNISSAFLTAMLSDWETGANIQYKLTNGGGGDTGWLETETVSSFTAFSSQPTKLIVRLVPKSSSPTVGYPAIRGVWCRAT